MGGKQRNQVKPVPAVHGAAINLENRPPWEPYEWWDPNVSKNACSILDLMDGVVRNMPDQTAFVWADDKGAFQESYTNLEVQQRYMHLAEYMISNRLAQKGDRVLLLYPPGLDFIFAMLACFRCGIIAVPAYPPVPNKLTADLRKLDTLLKSAEPTLVLTTKQYLQFKTLSSLATTWPGGSLPWIATDGILATSPVHSKANSSGGSVFGAWWKPVVDSSSTSSQVVLPTAAPSDIAYLQYTSGSTSDPKGVVITHDNLLQHMVFSSQRYRPCTYPVLVTWLPQYHDMGLTTYLGALMCGVPVFGMAPFTFLKNPLLWLKLITSCKGTHSFSPNFGYELCIKRARQNPQILNELDLSHMVQFANGAEPVHASTMQSFAEMFGQCGLSSPQVIDPSYGLAENVVFACNHKDPDEHWQVDAKTGRVSCGKPAHPVDMRVVNAHTCQECQDGEEGEIWMDSPWLPQEYWRMEETSASTFHGRLAPNATTGTFTRPPAARYLRTGDIGFMRGGFLYVCGRVKDLIIVGGRNIYPNDIEAALCDKFPQLRGGCLAVVSLPDAGGMETGEVAVVAELREAKLPGGARAVTALCAEVAAAVREEADLTVQLVALLLPRTIPKTTSGKIRRRETRQKLLDGGLKTLEGGFWLASQAATGNVGGGDDGAKDDGTSDNDGSSVLSCRLGLPLAKKLLCTFRSFNVSQLNGAVQDSGLASVQYYPLLDAINALVVRPLVIEDLLTSAPADIINACCKADVAQRRFQHSVALVTLTQGRDTRAKPGRAALRWQAAKEKVVLKSLQEAHRQMDKVEVLASKQPVIPVPSLFATPPPLYILPRHIWHLLQFLCSLFMYLLLYVSLVPSVMFAHAIVRDVRLHSPWRYMQFSNSVVVYGLLIPLVIPLWMLSFSILVMLMKWTILGRQCPGVLPRRSLAFLRWWMIDRLVDMWHGLVGYFIRDTLFMNLFCAVMGADVAWSARIGGKLFDFDLLTFEAHSVVKGTVLCRTLTSDYVYLDSVVVGTGAKVEEQGLVLPGCVVGSGSCVEPLCVIPEGTSTAPNTAYFGNPGIAKSVSMGKDTFGSDSVKHSGWLVFEIVKVVLLLLIMYSTFFCAMPAGFAWKLVGIPSFRYRPLILQVIFFFGTGFVIVVFTVLIKWLFIGVTRAGPVPNGLSYRLRTWLLGYMADVADIMFLRWFNFSPVMSLWYWSLGAKIRPLSSMFLGARSIEPHHADLLQAGDFFVVTGTAFEFESRPDNLAGASSGSTYTRINFGDHCETGFTSIVGPSVSAGSGAGVGAYTIAANTVIRPGTYLYGMPPVALQRNAQMQTKMSNINHGKLIGFALFALLSRFVSIGLVVILAIVPAYEFSVNLMYGCASSDGVPLRCTRDPPVTRPFGIALLAVNPMIILACCILLLKLMSLPIYTKRNLSREVPITSPVCILYTCYGAVLDFVMLILATPFYGSEFMCVLFRFFGAKVGKDVYINWYQWDMALLTLEDGACIDLAEVESHVGQFGALSFGKITIGKRACIGHSSNCCYQAQLDEGAVLGPGSMCRIGGVIPAGKYFQGCPAVVCKPSMPA